MNLKQISNKSLNLVSYFSKKEKCYGYPEVYNIEATNNCPMTCIMCPRKFMKRELGNIDINLYKKIIDQLKGYTNSIGLHHFGESLLHPKLDQAIKYANKNNVKTFLAVNASVLNPKIAKKIIDAGIYNLHISLDGTDERMYKKIRGKNADYQRALENTHEVVKYRKDNKKDTVITIGMINMKITKEKMNLFKKQWLESGVDEVVVKRFTTWDGSSKEIINMAEKDQFSEAFYKKNSLPCLRPWHKLTILWDGRVVPCCYDYDAKYVIGDIKKESLKDIWNNKRMQELRRQHLENDFRDNLLCRNCREKNGISLKEVFSPYFLQRIKNHVKGSE